MERGKEYNSLMFSPFFPMESTNKGFKEQMIEDLIKKPIILPLHQSPNNDWAFKCVLEEVIKT